ncbi:protein FAM83E [Chanos chanos]|uniref:Protein FAM83E n=1 Tax=Chanos chanos TaxID=29144 RepID=A0A6J2VPY9_CHACN|nr:protein FAM83E-like [Chanos chanos]
MPNSQEQSLDENVLFMTVPESSPEFCHCERERHALECLLSDGPGAFYTRLNTERLGPFLSPEEVNQINSWVEDYHCSELSLNDEDVYEESGSGVQNFSDHYFPMHSDTPAPVLELGWPERKVWGGLGHATVYTNPPMEPTPPIRQVIRSLLQGASKVIAVVTDRLTDSAVIGDLHSAASRGVPVYIILNRRSVQENFTVHKFRHPNIKVRMLGGKTFCSRNGKMVVGELKDNFVMIDLETVMVGSYSLTWSDAHLHRQLVTVMSGPAVESFDREFRVLYAASLPISDMRRPGNPAMKSESTHPLHQSEPLNLNTFKPVLMETVSSPPPPITDSPLDWEALGVIKRNDQGQENPVSQPGLWEEPSQCQEPIPGRQKAKPLILSVPQTETCSSLSDIMRRINPRQSSSGLTKRPAKTTVTRFSQSMLDLSSDYTDMTPRSQHSTYDSLPLTPALALMKKRNDDIKSALQRPPKVFLPPTRPRSSSFGLQREWRTPLRQQRSEEDK